MVCILIQVMWGNLIVMYTKLKMCNLVCMWEGIFVRKMLQVHTKLQNNKMVCILIEILWGNWIVIHTRLKMCNLVCIWKGILVRKCCKYIPNCKITKWYVFLWRFWKENCLKYIPKWKSTIWYVRRLWFWGWIFCKYIPKFVCEKRYVFMYGFYWKLV